MNNRNAFVLGQRNNARQHVKLPLHKFDTQQGEKRLLVWAGRLRWMRSRSDEQFD
jgi:hypothetical protein